MRIETRFAIMLFAHDGDARRTARMRAHRRRGVRETLYGRYKVYIVYTDMATPLLPLIPINSV